VVYGMWSSWLEMAMLGRDLHRGRYDVLLFDLRGHGQSDSSRLTMGRRERRDIRAVMNWAEDAGFTDDRIGWLGYSMGASTLLLEAAQNPGIQVAVMDSPYGNLPEVLKTQLSKHSHLPNWFNPGILSAARWVFGVRTDDLVPVRQAYQLASAAGATCLTKTLPGVEHVGAYDADPQGYVGLIETFFQDHLSP
jgi:uncharacterized protein